MFKNLTGLRACHALIPRPGAYGLSCQTPGKTLRQAQCGACQVSARIWSGEGSCFSDKLQLFLERESGIIPLRNSWVRYRTSALGLPQGVLPWLQHPHKMMNT